MKNPAISIIVPIYNMERYLEECLESIMKQTFTDWECIMIDDGSNDSSPAICEKFAALDSRFVVIHQQNSGLSNARNKGLHSAKGEFIGFVDADDWIEPQMYERLYEILTTNDAELAQVGYRTEYIGRHSNKPLTQNQKVINGEEAMRQMGLDHLSNYVWNRLHKRSIINCDFPDGRNFEDIYVYTNWLKKVNKMVLDPSILYHYRMRKGSIIHSDVARNRYDFFLSCIDRLSMIEACLESKNDEYRNAYINKSAVYASKIIAREEKDPKQRKIVIAKIGNVVKNYSLPSPKVMGLKKWWRSIILRNHPKMFTWLMRSVHIFDIDSKYRYAHLYE